MKPIIKIENLSKQYRLGTIGTGTLTHDLKRWWYHILGKEDPFLKVGKIDDRLNNTNSEYVWALRNINLEVMPGEVLGIIGKNGAGKSTLLKILSKVTGPTTGQIHFNGRIGSLLEVGTGFHQELTGRENIFLNGAILGMTKSEIKGKLDEIVEFSGCERYIDTPVKRYSSGMKVRLGFAVAAHLEPEILVVDEVLAVGDAEFQKKAIGKMQEVSKKDGRTVLFVSHNLSTIESLCSRGILLGIGRIVSEGEIHNVIRSYTNFGNVESNSIYKNDILDQEKEIQLIEAYVSSSEDEIKSSFFNTEEIILTLKINVIKLSEYLKIGFTLNYNGSLDLFTSFHNDYQDFTLKSGMQLLKFHIPRNLLNKGTYSVSLLAGIHRVKWIFKYENVLGFNILFKTKNEKMPVDSRHNALISPLLECTNIHING